MLRRVLVPIVLAMALVASPALAATSKYGGTSARNGVLKPGCHNYRYHWNIKPPTDVWMLETFLIDPTGDSIASGAVGSPFDKMKDRDRFRFCRNVTRPGVFKIKAKLTWQDGNVKTVKWLKKSKFRLKRAR